MQRDPKQQPKESQVSSKVSGTHKKTHEPTKEPAPKVEKAQEPDVTLEPAQEPSPRELQAIALTAKQEEHNFINVRLSLSELENYDEQLPESIVRALLDPDVPDFFIPIQAPGRRLARSKGHYLHTAFIRELIIFDQLPDRSK